MELIIQLGITFLIAGLAVYFIRRPSKHNLKPINILNNTLTDEEKTIRANWKRSLFIMLLGNLAIVFLSHSFCANFVNMELADEFLVISISEIVGLAIGGVFIYYFGYIKFGTKWLMCFLITFPIRCTVITIFVIQLILDSDLPSLVSSYLLIAHFISVALFIQYWKNSKRLYQLNRKIKKGLQIALAGLRAF